MPPSSATASAPGEACQRAHTEGPSRQTRGSSTGRWAGARRRRLPGAPGGRGARRASATALRPLDVLLDDLDYLHAHTGLDLLTPLGEVRDVHDQVVAVLNPLVGRRVQRELEDEVADLQAELEQAQQEVSHSETRLKATLSDLTRLEAFTSTLRFSPPGGSASPSPASASAPAASTPQHAPQPARPAAAAAAAEAGPALEEERSSAPEPAPQPAASQAAAAVPAAAAPAEPPQGRPKARTRGGMLDVRLDTPGQLREFWYPAEFSSKLLPGQLVSFEMFEEQWVLFRDAEGRAVCLVDECSQPACLLSTGQVVEGAVQCTHHGLAFDGSGACTTPTAAAPVRALPTREADGFVWVWPGEEAPGAEIPAFTRPPPGFQVHTELLLDVPVEHGLLLENLLDLAHAPFTHTSTFAKGWPIPDAVRFHTQRLLGGNWEPYPIDMSFEPPCGVLSTIGLAQPGRIERGLTAQQCTNHLHQLHVCIPAGPQRTRLLYRMSMDFLGWTRAVPGIQRFWAHIAQQVMGEDLVLVAGQQDRIARGGNAWRHPVAYDKLGIRYRRWRNALSTGDGLEELSARDALAKKFSAGELFALECPVGEHSSAADAAITNVSC